MLENEWRQLLSDYSRQLSGIEQLRATASPSQDTSSTGWYGFPPASDDQIRQVERRLQISLPDDLKTFYRVSNGWKFLGSYRCGIVPIERLNWLSESDPSLWSICEVDAEAPSDEAEREWWYEQGIRVRRSLMLNTLDSALGSKISLLFDPSSDSERELRYGVWASWNPAME